MNYPRKTQGMKPPQLEFRNSYVSDGLERPKHETPDLSEEHRKTAISTSPGEHKALHRYNIHTARKAKALMLWLVRTQGGSW